MFSLRTINAMSGTEFMKSFSAVYESSPWVAQRASQMRPFGSAEDLFSGMRRSVDEASQADQDALIRAHPDLGGKLARAGRLTADSAREQSRLGLDQLDAADYAAFDSLNTAYRQRFDFPFIICVGLLHDRHQILDAFRSRIGNTQEQERRQALDQIHLIARIRLSALVEDIPAPES